MHDRSRTLRRVLVAVTLSGGALLAGCGSSARTSSAPASSQPAPQSGASASGASASSPGPAASSPGALSPDAHSAATGDIPDTQVFLTFTSKGAGWSMKYPEGWTQSGSGQSTTFSDRNNLVRVAVGSGTPPTPASVVAELRSQKAKQPTLSFTPPMSFPLPADPAAVKATYTTESAPNPVTGKRVTLIVDRYVLHHGKKVATVDLGTPRGVDNVDAYRMMIRSFRWR